MFALIIITLFAIALLVAGVATHVLDKQGVKLGPCCLMLKEVKRDSL